MSTQLTNRPPADRRFDRRTAAERRRQAELALDANALELFAHVVAAGSFAEAARQLGQTRAAVSRRVAGIEAVLGMPLFARTTRSLGLTDAGRRLHGRARAVLEAADAARRAVRRDRGELSGTLRITATHSFGHAVLAPLLARFQHLHPDIRLDLLFTDRRIDLLGEGIDVAFRITRKPPPDWVAQPVQPLTVRAYAAPAPGLPLDGPSSLAGRPCLLFGAQGDAQLTRWVPAAGGEAVQVELAPSVSASSMDSLVAMARAGAGVVLTPDYCVADDVAAGRLADVLPGWTLPVAEGDSVQALTLPVPAASEAARALVRFVIDSVAAESPRSAATAGDVTAPVRGR